MIQPTKLPSQKFLRECFRYERGTGKLFWKKRPRKHFVSETGHKIWNKRWPGMEAFAHITKYGHCRGRVDGHAFLAHRVIWKIITGKEPPDVVDHRDRNGQNNRWQNLREATTSQNCINGSRRGVHCQKGRWRARITVDGKRVHIGYFGSEREAARARQTENKTVHGEFAPCA